MIAARPPKHAALVVLAGGALVIAGLASGGQRAVSTGKVIVWGCRSSPGIPGIIARNYGQCSVPPTATSGVTAISAGFFHNLALKTGGRVIAWGCHGKGNYGQCRVPVTAGSG